MDSIIGILIVLPPLIFFHELGHYFAAIKSGVYVEVFSIGFGPELFGYTDKRGTRWKFTPFLLGGYVKMKGETLTDNQSNDIKSEKDSFINVNLSSKIFILFSGPFANLVLGVLLISFFYSYNGRYETPAIISEVLENSPAEIAGLKSRDIIKEINNINITNFDDVKKIVQENSEKKLTFKILRGNNEKLIDVFPKKLLLENSIIVGRIGVKAILPILSKKTFFKSIYFGFFDSIQLSISWLNGLSQIKWFSILSLEKDKDIMGPIGIAKLSGDIVGKGFMPLLYFMAFMSINLGLINLLPIPPLDGGHIVIYLYQLIFKKPLPMIVQSFVMRLGIILLLLLMILVTIPELGLY